MRADAGEFSKPVQSGALAARSVMAVAAMLSMVSTAIGQRDELAFFDGTWIASNPPGTKIVFSRVLGGMRATRYPGIGGVVIATSDGKSGSNVKIASERAECYYFVEILNPKKMIWTLKFANNFSLCPQSATYEKDRP